jgi:hypothetical protein
MTPSQKIKYLIVARAGRDLDYPCEDINTIYRDMEDEDELWDTLSEVREGEVETGLPCEYSRHYESYSVAAKLPDGSWVGWTYWYGGGKHGEPESIDWMEDAYDLDCLEEVKLMTVRTFTKKEV